MKTIINGNIDEFIQWHDTDGNIINASDGGIICVNGVYHWYGLQLRDLPVASKGAGGQTTLTGVAMYASTDLVTWKYEGIVLACRNAPGDPLCGPMRFERPKILYNERTGKYVLWCHYVCAPGDHGTTPGTAEAGVAVCDTVNGHYEWLGTSRPIDDKGLVRDSTVYQDEDGSAYFIYDRMVGEDRCLHIVRLSEDYLSFTDDWKRLDAQYLREAAAVVKNGKYYYMVTSGLTGWEFNRAKYFRSECLFGPWEDMGDPCIGDDAHNTFRSQTTYIFKPEGSDTCIHMAERHNTQSFLKCSYIWLPIEFTPDGQLELRYRNKWDIADV
ncbi:MAG: family 43 glycosylhydrolase [Clostridia bacterium]|nr:family 43 glycosylhydrolase [Clostridia bacterium]